MNNQKQEIEESRGRGRPRFEPTDEERKQVEAMAGYGVGEAHIAALIRGGIGVSTLRERFKENLECGRAKAHAGIGKTLYQKAMGGDVASLIWWSKTQMRWTEAPRQIELSANISITEALAEARARIIDLADVEDATLSLSGDGCGDEYRMPSRTRVLAESSTDDASDDNDDQPRAEREVDE
jgi:hypothetical protein